MTANSPSLYNGGVEYGTAVTPGAAGYYQAAATATIYTGQPILCVAIAGRRIDRAVGSNGNIVSGMQSGSWSLGRSGDWFSTLSPNTASFSFVGAIDASPNDSIVVSIEVDSADGVSTHPDALFVGRVDTYTETQDAAGNITSTASGTDVIGILGQVILGVGTSPASIAAGTLQTIVETLATNAGINLTVVTDDALPTLLGDSSVNSSVLEYINRAELASNALLFLLGNGTLKAVIRQGLVAGSVTTIPLVGLDAPTNWTEQTSPSNIINDWRYSSSVGGTWSEYDAPDTVSPANAASQAAYGVHSFSIDDMLAASATVYSDLEAADALNLPRAVVTAADFPIYESSQNVLWLDPLDWVDHGGDRWQVMSVQHDASPGSWRMTMTADQTQNFLVAEPDPDPDDPTDAPGTVLVTHSYTSTKSSVVARTSGAAYAGNGAGDHLQVGYYSGFRYRSLIQFPIDWTDFTAGGHTIIRVKKATMTVRTTGESAVSFGSNPNVYIRRSSDSWTEGTFGSGSDSVSTGNSVIWPGPSTSTTGQQHRLISTATNNDVDIAITAIAQGWYDTGNNRGLRIHSANEDSSTGTIEFYSDDSAHPPTIEITVEVSA